MLAFIGFFVCQVQSQAPKHDQKISLEMPAAPLDDIAQELSKKSGVRINVAFDAQFLKATVLIHDQPLDDVLDSLASVLNLQRVEKDGSITLTPDKQFLLKQSEYNMHEDNLLWLRIEPAIKALAAATAAPVTGSIAPDESKLTDEILGNPEKLAKWAQGKAQIPKYRALAAYYQFVPQINQVVSIPYGYSLGKLNNPANEVEHVRTTDFGMPSANGTHVLVKYVQTTGDMQIVDVNGGGMESLEGDVPLIRYFTPPKELEKEPFAKYLADWEKPRPDKKKTVLDDGFDTGAPSKPTSQTLTLADHLQWIYDHSKASIVANAFRIPAADIQVQPGQETPAKYLDHLKSSEHLFMRQDKPIVQIKYGGYWRLLRTEPPEIPTRKLEAIAAQGKPGILDYGDFMHDVDRASFVRFDRKGRFVANFSLQPLIEARSVYFTLGSLNADQRRAFLAGAPVNLLINRRGYVWSSSYSQQRLPYSAGWDMQIDTPSGWVGAHFASIDALFQGGRLFGKAHEFLECIRRPGIFLRNEGRLPDVSLALTPVINLGAWIQLKSNGTVLLYIGTSTQYSSEDGVAYSLN